MLVFTLEQFIYVNDSLVEDMIHSIKQLDVIKSIPKTDAALKKVFFKILANENIENETGDIPYVSKREKDKVVCYVDVSYETNDDNEEKTVQMQLTIKKINLRKEVKKYIEENIDDITKNHLDAWQERYTDYKCADLRYDLNVNHDFSGDIENLVRGLGLPEDYVLDDKLQQIYINTFIKYAVKNFKR